MKKLLILLIVVFASGMLAQAQPTTDGSGVEDGIVTKAVIIEGDTVPLFWIPTVRIYGPIVFKSKVQVIEFTRMVKHIKRVYPYAKLIGNKVNEYNKYLNGIGNDRERERELDRIESEMRAQLEDQLVKLTFTQGKILMKLIYRETSFTTYNLIKDFRGGITATFWQTFGKIFGYNLKVTYDPIGIDHDIETIVVMIENGTI
ncbi:MAG: hypothetical protein A2W93_13780 [Bacteroidetes bacterium GWF2_43_63]|nr:MAG: hypothetical protein A2W94_03975 [Bacteroidetes bacterium GWE2_42_42]OFY55058.1 MAG: hypothetical protein A2W93_13780 [Bacteroidetes bacterium GWF2_43_63]HBG69595.1 hypothetical protein [Bacteroidales bacterium]HCB60666.1 hypothetical protein [Bacteroidales bacterium]HCY24030.1 hypothetical protein [Bacteroidales bacterium]